MKTWWDKINKSFLETKIQQVKNEAIKKYLLELLNYRVLFIKLMVMLFTTLICGLCFFILRQHALNNYDTLIVVFNKGSAWGLGGNWPVALTYVLKMISVLIYLAIFLFSKKWNIFLFGYIIAINSFFNFIDKTMVDYYGTTSEATDAVVDYMPFKVFNLVCNSADMFIVVSNVWLVINLVRVSITNFKERKKLNKVI